MSLGSWAVRHSADMDAEDDGYFSPISEYYDYGDWLGTDDESDVASRYALWGQSNVKSFVDRRDRPWHLKWPVALTCSGLNPKPASANPAHPPTQLPASANPAHPST